MAHIEALKRKILAGIDLERWLYISRFRNRKIVFTNGCFDIIHRGHIHYLAEASSLGDLLVVGLNTDASVRRIKGPKRPLIDQESRALALASMCFVSAVVLFDDDTPYNLIKTIKPDFLVKGGDYKLSEIAGHDFVTAYGGKVLALELVQGYSTTDIIRKINPDH
jgi:D-glycero-beta-D-manno-heptose 1-phosphate adenylyltransferase